MKPIEQRLRNEGHKDLISAMWDQANENPWGRTSHYHGIAFVRPWIRRKLLRWAFRKLVPCWAWEHAPKGSLDA
jgi:hypothetical protein